jgi:hypothetical protein
MKNVFKFLVMVSSGSVCDSSVGPDEPYYWIDRG